MKLAICTKFQVNRMNCVESRRGGGPIDPPPPSRLCVTIFSRRLLYLGLKYFVRFADLPENSLAKQAFITSKSLFDAHKSRIHTNLHLILQQYNIDRPNNQEILVTDTTCNSCLKIMKAKYLKIWQSKLISLRKLNVYQSFKTNYNEEPYLMAIHIVEQRIHYTKFRISNHNLAIEERRYSKETVPIENRLMSSMYFLQ